MKQAFELRSKLIDGLLASGVLVLFQLLMIMLVKPLQQIFGRPGLLIYTLILMAVAVVCLEQSLSEKKEEFQQIGLGITAGMVGWVVIELSNWLGGQSLMGETAIFSLMLLFLVVSILWQHTHLLGFRYYVVLTFLGWAGHLVAEGLTLLVGFVPQLDVLLRLPGYLGGVGLVAALLYNFWGTHSRQERVNAAIAAWFAAMALIYTLRGGFI